MIAQQHGRLASASHRREQLDAELDLEDVVDAARAWTGDRLIVEADHNGARVRIDLDANPAPTL